MEAAYNRTFPAKSYFPIVGRTCNSLVKALTPSYAECRILLAELKEKYRLSAPYIGLLLGVGQSTVEGWLYTERKPCAIARTAILRLHANVEEHAEMLAGMQKTKNTDSLIPCVQPETPENKGNPLL